MTIGIVVPTYGPYQYWSAFAKRALRSVETQSLQPETVVWEHAETLQLARNRGAEHCDTEWLIFLDADDELDPRYVEAMSNAEGDIRRPSTLGVVEGVEDLSPVMIRKPSGGLSESNYIVIGAMHRREDFLAVGGFSDYPILEDWDLWCRMVQRGARVVDVPEAIYRVNVRQQSRNSHESQHGQILQEIRRKFQCLSQ